MLRGRGFSMRAIHRAHRSFKQSSKNGRLYHKAGPRHPAFSDRQVAQRALSKNVEAVVLALEKRGVVITESGVEFTGKQKRR